ncbi:hypothetical protein [Massilia sp. IC2-476]|uniref:hypothetical protein n=1 Tax=Massilia sp. IC2-476 TaxID=2887199 RepID=UPI001D11207E|nr:hypothetical protein [Massilia sp. IC2-476]MCC2972996.1 hypothetical protein [Massilia sp. IC2-476]
MRFPFLLFFLAVPSASATAPVAPVAACLPLRAAQGEPDGWLLLATVIVCMAGRLAAQPRRRKKSR